MTLLSLVQRSFRGSLTSKIGLDLSRLYVFNSLTDMKIIYFYLNDLRNVVTPAVLGLVAFFSSGGGVTTVFLCKL